MEAAESRRSVQDGAEIFRVPPLVSSDTSRSGNGATCAALRRALEAEWGYILDVPNQVEPRLFALLFLVKQQGFFTL